MLRDTFDFANRVKELIKKNHQILSSYKLIKR